MREPSLSAPVRRVLTDSVDQAKLTRLWQGVVGARAKRAATSKRPWIIAVASAVVAALAVAVFLRSSTGAPLRLSDGRDVPAKMATGKALLSFDDRSTIDVGAGGKLDLLESTPNAFAMAMRGGAMLFDVTPGGPRAWRIECGPVTVEVVGTRFSVERATAFVRVAVSRGAVLVRGEEVPDRVVRLGPGQAIVVPLVAPAADETQNRPTPAAHVATDLDRAPAAQPGAGAPSPPDRVAARPAAAASSVAAAEAAPAAGAASVEAPNAEGVASIDDGLAAADALRRAGRFSEAAAALELSLAEHGGDASAPLAEFSLGRLYLDSLGNAALAKAHFSRALARGLPAAIAEDAEARWVEASARAGDLPGAKEGALRYHARYPNGRHGSDVERWAAGTQ